MCGELTLSGMPDAHPDTLTPPHHQSRGKIWWKTRGWDKDREITHQLLSWAKQPYLLPINNSVGWWETETNPKRPFTSTSTSSQGQLHSWSFYMAPEQGDRNWGCWQCTTLCLALFLMFFPFSSLVLSHRLEYFRVRMLHMGSPQRYVFLPGIPAPVQGPPWEISAPPWPLPQAAGLCLLPSPSLTLLSAALFLSPFPSLLTGTSCAQHGAALAFPHSSCTWALAPRTVGKAPPLPSALYHPMHCASVMHRCEQGGQGELWLLSLTLSSLLERTAVRSV